MRIPQSTFRLREVTPAVVGLAILVSLGACVPDADAAEATAPEKKPPRPERTAAERDAAARQLRGLYASDPAGWPSPHIDPGVEWREVGLLPAVDHPQANPYTAAKASLGKTLFFDARLSANGTIACASCHDPGRAWTDGRASSGPDAHGPRRNAPTICNTAFQTTFFWDGRAATLEQQAEEALTNPAEMAATPDAMVRLLASSPGYRRLFADAFPDQPIAFSRAVEAIACFERTVVGGRSRFDAFMRGDATALSDAEILGLDLFRRDARCMNCHHGPTFSDGRFHNLGLNFYLRSNEDQGRYAVTGDPKTNGQFRTPSLRDVTRTAPLMHTGTFRLPGVLNMYNAGMATLKRREYQRHDPLFPVKSPLLKPLGLNRQDLADLAAFLGSLEEPGQSRLPPGVPAIADVDIEPAPPL